MAPPPFPLDEWRRWVLACDCPCAFLRKEDGVIAEVVASPSFLETVADIREGAPFPPETLLARPFPLFGEGWYWVEGSGGEEALDAFVRSVASKASTPFFALGADRSVLSSNASFRELFPVSSAPRGRRQEGWDALLDRAFSGEVVQVETDILFHRRMGAAYRLTLVPVGSESHCLLGTVHDIADSKKEGAALRESEARLRTLFQSAPEGLATVSKHGFVLDANRLVCEMSGLSADQLRAKHILTFFPEEERPRLAEAFRKASEAKTAVRLDLRYRHPELGETMHVYLAIAPMEGVGDEQFLLLFQDRTRLQILGTGRNRGEQRYESLFQDSPDAIFTCLSDGTLLTFNRKASLYLGWDEGSIGQKIGLAHAGGIPWSLVRGWIGRVEEGVSSGKSSLRTSCTLTDVSGLRRTFVVFGHPYWDAENRPIGLSVHLHDETESHILQERLAESREQFRSLVEYSSDLVFQATPDWRVLYVNPAVKRLLGADPDSLLGRRIKPGRFLSREHWRKLRRFSVEAIQKMGIVAETMRFRRLDGTEFWGRLSLIPIVQQDRLRTVLGIVRDVDDLFQAQTRLEEQAETLRETVCQLEEASRLQDQFVANVTHELRTPLTTILVTSEVLERQFDQGTPASQRRQVGLIRSNGRLLQEQINDLLDLAKLKQGKYLPVPKPFALAEFLQELRESVEPLFAQKHLAFEVKVEESVPTTVESDASMLRKVLLNLLSNACKFTEKGGAHFEVRTTERELLFQVRDSGVGIREADIPKIFEEFRQLDSTDARRQPGTGLGLSISDQFTELLGGRIEVASAPGSGSTFTVLLPLSHLLPAV